MSRIALVMLLAFGALAGTAQAGGWATVELGEPAPSDLAAGTPWKVELIVKQHGVTPLDDVTPSVEITNAEGVTKTFPATHAGKPGTYVAEVTFPGGGEWNTRIYDGFTDATPHRLKPLERRARERSGRRLRERLPLAADHRRRAHRAGVPDCAVPDVRPAAPKPRAR